MTERRNTSVVKETALHYYLLQTAKDFQSKNDLRTKTQYKVLLVNHGLRVSSKLRVKISEKFKAVPRIKASYLEKDISNHLKVMNLKNIVHSTISHKIKYKRSCLKKICSFDQMK